jgi:aminopeptidase N
VATHADEQTWEQLHTLARTAHSATEKQRYFTLLGRARDRVLAQRALDLTLTQEVDITTRPELIRTVSLYYPELAFDFAVAHLAEVNGWLEVDSRTQFEANLISSAQTPAAIDKLKGYARAHIPGNARRTADVAAALIDYRIRARRDAIPRVDHWLQAPRS